MQMERIKGLIDRIEDGRLVVVSEKTGEEYFFAASDIPDAMPGEKIDLLAGRENDEDFNCSVIAVKSRKKIKPLKMPNFNTLVGHMIKTRDRLVATLGESEDNEACSNLREKIAWLDRGISLFS